MLLVVPGIRPPSGTATVRSRSLKKSAGKMNMSDFAFAAMQVARSQALIGWFAARASYALKQVGHFTERWSALNEALSFIHAPPWYSPRSVTLILRQVLTAIVP